MHEASHFSFCLDNGLEISVRPETRDDAQAWVDLLQHVNPQTRLERAAQGRPSPEMAGIGDLSRALWGVGQEGTTGWLAFADLSADGHEPVAGGRYICTTSDEAELLVVVRDDMQGQGIGSRLLYFVLDQARVDGIRRIITCFDNRNEAAWQVLQYSPYHITWQPRGRQVEVVIHLQARTTSSTVLN